MNPSEKAVETQIRNIQVKTGRSLEQLFDLLATSGIEKHGGMVALLKENLGLGHGDANTIVHLHRQAQEQKDASPGADPADELYSGAKSQLRSIHDALMAGIRTFGSFEIAPKKTYLSLRRRKQFAMIGPATKSQVEVGLNVEELPDDERLKELPPGRMCHYTTRLASAAEVDEALLGWIRRAYDAAG